MNRMRIVESWKRRARELKRDALALYFACGDRRTPWYAKVTAALVVGYAFSPIDLIPDFIPVIGQLDDFLIVPLGVLLVCRMIPVDLMDEFRSRAHAMLEQRKPIVWVAGVIVVLIWALLAGLSYRFLTRTAG